MNFFSCHVGLKLKRAAKSFNSLVGAALKQFNALSGSSRKFMVLLTKRIYWTDMGMELMLLGLLLVQAQRSLELHITLIFIS